MIDEDELLDIDLEIFIELKILLQYVYKQLLSVVLRCLWWRMVESVIQVVWYIVCIIVMDFLIDVDEVEEDYG